MKFFLILFLISFVGFSQEKSKKITPWTLEAAVEHAVENNLQIKQAYLDVLDAETLKLQAKGNFLPSLNLSANHSWNVGLNRNLTTNLLEDMTTQFSSGSIDLGINIYNGRRNIYQLMTSNLGILATKYQLEDMKEDVMLLVVNGYLQTVFSRENLIVQTNQLSVAKSELEETKELVNAGVLPKGELLELEATLASQEQIVVNAENDFEIARISLAQLLLINDYKNFSIADNDYEMVSSVIMEKSVDELYNEAIKSRNEILLAETNVEIAKTNLKIAKASYQPSLSGYYSYNSRVSYADRLVSTDDFTQIPFGVVEGTGERVLITQSETKVVPHLSILDQLRANDGQNFGLSLRIPVLNGLSVKNNVQRSKVNLLRSSNQLNQQKLNFERIIYQAYSDAKGAIKNYEAAKKTTIARKEAYQYALDRFSLGASTSLQFSQAKQRYDSAISNELRSKFDAIFQIKILEFYFGIPLKL